MATTRICLVDFVFPESFKQSISCSRRQRHSSSFHTITLSQSRSVCFYWKERDIEYLKEKKQPVFFWQDRFRRCKRVSRWSEKSKGNTSEWERCADRTVASVSFTIHVLYTFYERSTAGAPRSYIRTGQPSVVCAREKLKQSFLSWYLLCTQWMTVISFLLMYTLSA